MAVATPKRPQKRARREPMRIPLAEMTNGVVHDGGLPSISTAPLHFDVDVSTPKRRKVDPFCDDSALTDGDRSDIAQVATPTSPKHDYHPYLSDLSVVKSMFSRGSRGHILANDPVMVGRQTEEAALMGFFEQRLQARYSEHGAALYVSGPPGTGKSALLQRAMDKVFRNRAGLKTANINCMLVNSASQIMDMIHKQLCGVDDGKWADMGFHRSVEQLEGMFMCDTEEEFNSRPTHMVVLDEIDHILTRDQDVLFRIFEWAFAKGSRLILVGIANALDLTDRFLPRLKANNFYPDLLKFKPYDAAQIGQIIKGRIDKANAEANTETDGVSPQHIHPAAIQLCARKCSANTGDLRKAFDICRKALEIAEHECRLQLTRGEAGRPLVSIATMARVCSQVFGGSNSQRIRVLNLQQKAVLCSVASAEKAVAVEAITAGLVEQSLTVQRLYDHYAGLCKKHGMLAALPFNEFLDVVNALESNSVVNVSGVCGRKSLGSSGGRGRASRGGGGASKGDSAFGLCDDFAQRRISSNVQSIDIIGATEDVQFLHKFL